MKWASTAIGCWFLGVLLCGALFAQTPTSEPAEPDVALPLLVSVDLSAQEITVGDRVEATLMVVWMGEATTEPARFPTWQETWGKAEVLHVGDVAEMSDASGRQIWKQVVTLTAFRPGDFELPSVTVALPLAGRTVEAVTDAAKFTIGTVLPQPATPDESQSAGGQSAGGQPAQPPAQEEIPEPKGPAGAQGLDANQGSFFWTLGVLSALLAVGLVWTSGAVARQPEEVTSVSEPVDPLRLLSPLDELRERLSRLDPKAAAEPLHTGLSFAVRTYLGRRLHFHGLESTTTEIQRLLRRANLSADVNLRVVRLLRDADAVKFARAEVTAHVAERRVAEAGDLARQIEHEMAPTPRLDAVQAGANTNSGAKAA